MHLLCAESYLKRAVLYNLKAALAEAGSSRDCIHTDHKQLRAKTASLGFVSSMPFTVPGPKRGISKYV